MRLAQDDITIRIDGETLFLRPTLRAAYRLERSYGGFDNLVRAIVAERATVIADVLFHATGSERARTLAAIGEHGFQRGLGALVAPLIDYVLLLAGVDLDETAKAAKEPKSAKSITFADYHARLYQIATGWLGWTPATAWDATPAEILVAYKGRVEMLRAIFGGGASDDSESSGEHTADEISEGIAALKMMAARGADRVR